MASPILRTPPTIVVKSKAFAHGSSIPKEYTCQGRDISPPLEISHVPPTSKALAHIMDDPDAPHGTFTHWTWWNVPPTTTVFPEGVRISASGGVEGRTDFGRTGYGGPCPPSGRHRYYFRFFALSEPLPLRSGAPVSEVWKALEGRTLAWGELMGTYEKTR